MFSLTTKLPKGSPSKSSSAFSFYISISKSSSSPDSPSSGLEGFFVLVGSLTILESIFSYPLTADPYFTGPSSFFG